MVLNWCSTHVRTHITRRARTHNRNKSDPTAKVKNNDVNSIWKVSHGEQIVLKLHWLAKRKAIFYSTETLSCQTLNMNNEIYLYHDENVIGMGGDSTSYAMPCLCHLSLFHLKSILLAMKRKIEISYATIWSIWRRNICDDLRWNAKC